MPQNIDDIESTRDRLSRSGNEWLDVTREMVAFTAKVVAKAAEYKTGSGSRAYRKLVMHGLTQAIELRQGVLTDDLLRDSTTASHIVALLDQAIENWRRALQKITVKDVHIEE